MYNIYKITHSEDDTFFVSDMHYTHGKPFIYEPRGYASSEDHIKGTKKEWNKRCSNTSIVFHLGDIIFGDPTGDKLIDLFNELNFKDLYVLPGNHTSGWRQLYEQLKLRFYYGMPHHVSVFPLYWTIPSTNKRVIFLPNYFEIRLNSKHHIILSHYPIASWNCMNKGAYHFSGHCHGSYAGSAKDTGQGLQVDVGIESFSGPVSFTFLQEFLKDRKPLNIDHHTTGFVNGEEDSQYKNTNNDISL